MMGMLISRMDGLCNNGATVLAAANRVQATADGMSRFGLHKRDIVLNRVGSLSHVGKTALIDKLAEPKLFESNMMRFPVDEERIRSKFGLRVLNSPFRKSQLIGAGQTLFAVPPEPSTCR